MSTKSDKTAWVEIHGAILNCPCGHETDFTDKASPYCSRAYVTCAGCSRVWGTHVSAECDVVETHVSSLMVGDEFIFVGDPRVRTAENVRYDADSQTTHIEYSDEFGGECLDRCGPDVMAILIRRGTPS